MTPVVSATGRRPCVLRILTRREKNAEEEGEKGRRNLENMWANAQTNPVGILNPAKESAILVGLRAKSRVQHITTPQHIALAYPCDPVIHRNLLVWWTSEPNRVSGGRNAYFACRDKIRFVCKSWAS